MHFTSDEIGAWVGAYMWPLIRIGAFVATAPFFGSRSSPMRIRLIIALALTIVIAPIVPPVPNIDPISPAGMLVLLNQILIGVALGLALHFVFEALVMAGQLIAAGMGLSFAAQVDPTNGQQTPTVSHFYSLFGMLLFLSIDGHLAAISVLAESFRILPVGEHGLALSSIWDLVSRGTWLFAAALVMSLPVVVALLVVNVAFGVMTRASPQLNIFAVGFPITLTLGFALIIMTLPGINTLVTQWVDESLTLMRHLVAQS